MVLPLYLCENKCTVFGDPQNDLLDLFASDKHKKSFLSIIFFDGFTASLVIMSSAIAYPEMFLKGWEERFQTA